MPLSDENTSAAVPLEFHAPRHREVYVSDELAVVDAWLARPDVRDHALALQASEGLQIVRDVCRIQPVDVDMPAPGHNAAWEALHRALGQLGRDVDASTRHYRRRYRAILDAAGDLACDAIRDIGRDLTRAGG